MGGSDLGDDGFMGDIDIAFIPSEMPVADHTTPSSTGLPPVVGREREFAENTSSGLVASIQLLNAMGDSGGRIPNGI